MEQKYFRDLKRFKGFKGFKGLKECHQLEHDKDSCYITTFQYMLV